MNPKLGFDKPISKNNEKMLYVLYKPFKESREGTLFIALLLFYLSGHSPFRQL